MLIITMVSTTSVFSRQHRDERSNNERKRVCVCVHTRSLIICRGMGENEGLRGFEESEAQRRRRAVVVA